MAVSNVIQELLWVNSVLMELGFDVVLPSIIYCDNQSAIALSNNSVHHGRSKHIDIKHHFIRDVINNNKVEMKWVESSNQVADIMTKPLSGNSFIKLRNEINLKSIENEKSD